MDFNTKLKELIYLLENWFEPDDNVQLEQWFSDANSLAYSYEFSDTEQISVDKIMEIYKEQFKTIFIQKEHRTSENSMAKEYMDELLKRNQTEQRTPEWYAQMTTIISASEVGNLYASPRIRAKMVLSKTEPYKQYAQSLAVLSDMMSAFDWGIRFEPVVKQIYEYKYGAVIKELGRLIHKIDNRCSASPDGLVYDSSNKEKIGRLIEIKCPVTREIDGSVPKEYYEQMQMQLHVTGCEKCDYIEAQFSSKYNNIEQKKGPGLYNGFIALIRFKETTYKHDFYYIYSPININIEWIPDIKEGEEIVEVIPWRLLKWNEQVIVRNEEWWTNIKPLIGTFWDDVEKARQGQFIVPESTRPPKKPRIEKCMIIITKLD